MKRHVVPPLLLSSCASGPLDQMTTLICRVNAASRLSSCINVSQTAGQLHGSPVPCIVSRNRDGAVPGQSTGAWSLSAAYLYVLDLGLAAALASTLRGRSVIELGAGKGCYTAWLRAAGVDVRGFDGAPGVDRLTGGLVQQADLTLPLRLERPAEYALCLEVAEHIPKRHEAAFLDNLRRSGSRGLILSWSTFADQASNGHVNPRSNAWVVRRLVALGFEHDVATQQRLRASVHSLPWFRGSLLAFTRANAPS